MRSILKAAVFAGLSAFSLSGGAVAGPVVIELYTSQGCSSCPPADALVNELAKRDDVLPLALHVDYWDYIGWKDEFARPSHTTRQKGYAAAAGHRTIYTPQMIVGGQDHVVGYKPMRLADLIAQHATMVETVDLSLALDGDVLSIDAAARAHIGKTVVQLVRYMPENTVSIGRGENAGRTITYSNVVSDWQVLGEWEGTDPINLQVEVSGDEPIVVLVQRPRHGAIIAAERIR